MTLEELDVIQKRLNAGTIKPSDVKKLIDKVRSVLQPESKEPEKQPDTETKTPKLTEEALEESQEEVSEVQQETEESPKKKNGKSK